MTLILNKDNKGDIKKFYDEILNKMVDLKFTNNDISTPIDCVEDMINKIPEDFWKNPDNKILDPCCGCGNFPVILFYKLIKYHSKEHILDNMLYFNDINEVRLNVLKDVFNYDGLNVTMTDFMKLKYNFKFNLIVANPPFAKIDLDTGKRASKNHNLIGSFIYKSLECLTEGGFLLYITPDNWMSYAIRNTLIRILTGLQIVYINIHQAKKYFKKIGSSFVWYLIENRPSYKCIEIDGVWNKKNYSSVVNSEVRNYIPLYYTKEIQSILNKTIDKDNKKFNIQTSSDLHRYTKASFLNTEKTDVYKFRIIHTPSQTVWSSRPHKYQDGYKVYIPITTYYEPFVETDGMTQSMMFIICESEKNAIKNCAILKHPLYRFINNICRYGNFNNIQILQKMPLCDDHEKVYDYFNITNDEKKIIEMK